MVNQIIADVLMVLGGVFLIILIILVVQILFVVREMSQMLKNVRNITKLLEYPVVKSLLAIIQSFKKSKNE